VDKPVFPPSVWIELAKENPLGRHDITARDAQDWFDLVWPAYKQHRRRIRKPNHKLRIAQWWLRVLPAEIDKARERGVELRRGKVAEKLTLAAESAFAHAPLSPRSDLPPLTIGRGVKRG
jgi:hypothetical protein